MQNHNFTDNYNCKTNMLSGENGILSTNFIDSKVDKNSMKENIGGAENKPCLKMPLKMNRYIESKLIKDISLNDYFIPYKSKTEGRNKPNKSLRPEICSSCQINSIKNSKCRTGDERLHLTLKGETPLCFNNNNKTPKKLLTQHNGTASSDDNHSATMRLKLLIQFLDQMRHMVVTQKLSLETFKLLSERLLKDNMKLELLLLIDLVIRVQVLQMIKLISRDLCQNNVTSAMFIGSIFKKYRFLISISREYRKILKDYESDYLSPKGLSFDSICRAHFAHLLHVCNDIKLRLADSIDNVQFEHLCDSNTASINEHQQMKDTYFCLQLDFRDTNLWEKFDNALRRILDCPDNTIASLIDFINFTYTKSTNSRCKNEVNDHLEKKTGYYSAVLQIIHHHHHMVDCCKPLDRTQSHQCKAPPLNTVDSARLCVATPDMATSPSPSSEPSSSSNKSNGYDSCASTSSFDVVTDDDDDDIDEQFFLQWKMKYGSTKCAFVDETRAETPTEDDTDWKSNECPESHNGWHPTDTIAASDSQEADICKFNELYEQYLAENENLLDQTSLLSLPRCFSAMEKAGDLKLMITNLMRKFKRNLQIQEDLCDETDVDQYMAKYMSVVVEDEANTTATEDVDNVDTDTCSVVNDNWQEFENLLASRIESNNESSQHPTCLEILLTKCQEYGKELTIPRVTSVETFSEAEKIDNNDFEKEQTVSKIESVECVLPPVDCKKPPLTNNTHRNSSDVTNELLASNCKVCNCCQCEMFGAKRSAKAPLRVTAPNVVEKLRTKLRNRRKANGPMEMKNGTEAIIANETELPDVDSLVQFINGNDVVTETKNKAKTTGKSKPKKAVIKKPVLAATVIEIGPERRCSSKEDLYHTSDAEDDIYDPVVEEFKRFCSTLVISEPRKKLHMLPNDALFYLVTHSPLTGASMAASN